jgi:hypothetical protein
MEVKDENELSEQETNLMGGTYRGTSTGEQSEEVEKQESTEQESPKSSPDGGSEEVTEPEKAEELPDEYQGKSAVEIAKMHQQAVKKIGEQGTELGQTRKMIDEHILQNIPQEKKEPEPDVSDQMYSDPGAYTERIKKETAEEVLGVIPKMLDAREAFSKLDTDFPDRALLVQSADFLAWRDANVPVAIQQAGVNDPSVAHYVLSEYAKVTGNSEAQAKAEENKTTRRRTAAGAASVQPTAQTGEKGVWKRSDIMDMIKNKPQEYEARQDEIIKAYQEGRVRS